MARSKPNLTGCGPWKQGKFDVSRSNKFVITESGDPVYRSSYEWLFMKWCETADDVVSWGSEPFSIRYVDPTQSKQKYRNYWIDFTARLQNNAKWWIEVKPWKQVEEVNRFKRIYESLRTSTQKIAFAKEHKTAAMNYSKWVHAKEAARQQNAEFKIVTEKTLKRL